MQFEITDEAAIAFSETLYRQLAHGLPVDAALGPARRAIVSAQKEAEFGTPVLFLRAADARLFDVERHLSAVGEHPGESPPTPSRRDAEIEAARMVADDSTRVTERVSEALDSQEAAASVEAAPYAEKADAAVAAVRAVSDARKPRVALAAMRAAPDELKADIAAATVRAVPDAGKRDVAVAAVDPPLEARDCTGLRGKRPRHPPPRPSGPHGRFGQTGPPSGS